MNKSYQIVAFLFAFASGWQFGAHEWISAALFLATSVCANQIYIQQHSRLSGRAEDERDVA